MDAATDWDLQAVVRGYSAATSAVSPLFNLKLKQQDSDDDILCDSQPLFNINSSSSSAAAAAANDVVSNRSVKQEALRDVYLPFLRYSPVQPTQESPQLADIIVASSTTSNARAQIATTRRWTNKVKRTCQVSCEDLSCDAWSWRKYGQKPIKGSPYPRGYYKCSTSKTCLARRQVERDRTSPNMFIVTYTGEHNHPMPMKRNSLAGTTRHKATEAATPQPTTSGGETNKLTDEDDYEFEEPDMALMDVNAPEDDDLFEGLPELSTSDDSFR